MSYFSTKYNQNANPSEFFVEQRVKSNEQREKVTSSERKVTSTRAKSNEQ